MKRGLIKRLAQGMSILLVFFLFSACNKGENQVKESIETQSIQEEIVKKEETTKNNQDLQSIEYFKDIQKEYSNVDTSDWKTYTNKNSLFSFKHPKEWRVIEEGYLYRLEEIGEDFYFEGIKTSPLSISLNGECIRGDYKTTNKLEDVLSDWGKDFEIEKKRLGNFMVYETMTHLSKNFFVGFDDKKECYFRMDWMILSEIDSDRKNEEIYKGVISTLKFL